MANNRTLTAADAIIAFTVMGLYDSPFRLQGFSADDVTSMDNVDEAETMQGVDGRLSGGFVPAKIRQSVVLQADSESNDIMENWRNRQRSDRVMYVANGIILLRSTGRKYNLLRGFLVNVSPFPSARRTLGPRTWGIDWENVLPAPM